MSTSEKCSVHEKELIVGMLWESTMKRVFPSDLNEKMRSVLAHWDYVHLNHSNDSIGSNGPDDSCKPLDITLDTPLISFEEKNIIQLEIEKAILKYYPEMLETFDSLIDEGVQNLVSEQELTPAQNHIVQLSLKLYKLLQQSQRTTVMMCELIKEVLETRLNHSAKESIKRAEMSSLKNKVTELEAKLVNIQLKKFIYDKSTIKQYIDYYEKMKDQLQEYKDQVLKYKKSLKLN